MVSIRNLIGVALFATVAIAQAPITNFSSSDINELTSSTTDPSDATKLAWCGSQKTLCGTLCGGNAEMNQCDQNTLNFTCTCSSNHSMPALQYYRNSMISNECFSILGKCLAQNANDLSSQQNCMSKYICGNATDAQASTAGSSGSAASTSASGLASAAAATGSQSAASGSGVSSTSAHNGAMISYGEYAPPMFVMMMVGALASFL